MAKETFFNNEVAPYKTGKLTLSVVPDLRPAVVENYNQIIDRGKSKITIFINDFSGGKGDHAKKVYYNMDIANYHFLYERAKDRNGGHPFQYYKTKIFGAYPEAGGKYNGLCKSFRLIIRRDLKDANGEILRAPWSIQIKNGYGKAVKTKIGGYFEESNSFQEAASVTARLTDEDFLALFENIKEAYEANLAEIAKEIIPKGRAKAQELREIGSKIEGEPVFDAREEAADSTKTQAESPAPVDTAPKVDAPQSLNTNGKTFPVTIKFLSEFNQIKDKGVAAKVKNINSEKDGFILYFSQVPQEVQAAKNSREPISLLVYMKGSEVWTDGAPTE